MRSSGYAPAQAATLTPQCCGNDIIQGRVQKGSIYVHMCITNAENPQGGCIDKCITNGRFARICYCGLLGNIFVSQQRCYRFVTDLMPYFQANASSLAGTVEQSCSIWHQSAEPVTIMHQTTTMQTGLLAGTRHAGACEMH